MRFFIRTKKPIFRDFFIKILSFTLLKILSQYDIIINDTIKSYI